MKIIVVIITGAGLLAMTFFMFAPESRVSAVKAEFRRMTGDPGQICFDEWADRLKDPGSARIVGYRIKGGRVHVSYRAKNSFGTYLRGEFECPIINGKVNKTQALIEKNESFIKEAEKLIDRLER